jgi:hypothetical protein
VEDGFEAAVLGDGVEGGDEEEVGIVEEEKVDVSAVSAGWSWGGGAAAVVGGATDVGLRGW